MKKVFFVVLLVLLLLLLFGCSSPEEIAKQNSTINNFIEENPDVEFKSIKKLSEDDFREERDFWESNCDQNISLADYYKIIFEGAEVKLTTLFETSQMKLICGVIEGKAETKAININTNSNTKNDNPNDMPEQADDENALPNNETHLTEEPEECEETWICTGWSDCVVGKQTRNCQKIVDCGYNSEEEIERSCDSVSTCTEDWSCTEWSYCEGAKCNSYGCVGGIKTRTCLDLANCGTTENKPEESQNCEWEITCVSNDNTCHEGCIYQNDNDCDCITDSDCLTNDSDAAAICDSGYCIDSSVPQPLQIGGNLDAFCTAYMNNCQESSTIDLIGGTNGFDNLQAQVYEPTNNPGECNIKVLWDNGNQYIVNFWVDIGDSVEICKHNVPIYFYNSANEICGSFPCYGEFP